MKKYSVMIPFFCDVTVEVEAESIDEARERAVKTARGHLCHQCSQTVTMGDMDLSLEPEIIEMD